LSGAKRTGADGEISLGGLRLANRLGIAAGGDKDGTAIAALAALGFGSVEVGTVTPKAQPGNPKPRMFRLPEYRAIINRLGFNNDGVDALVANVSRARRKDGLLGINIGKNKDTPNEAAARDYLHCLERVYPLADYVTVNISSPNTAGLRELQEEQALRKLVGSAQLEELLEFAYWASPIGWLTAALAEREEWLNKTGALEDEWLVERRVALLVDQGKLTAAKALLESTRFQLVHQRYARTRLWIKIQDGLGLETKEPPRTLGEDNLAEFGAYREYQEDRVA